MNKLNAAPGDGSFITAAEIKAKDLYLGIDRTPDHKFWMDFDFMTKNNDWFHHEDYYPFFGGETFLLICFENFVVLILFADSVAALYARLSNK